MFVSVLGITHLISNMYIQLVVGFAVGGGIYIGGAYLFKIQELNEVVCLLNIKK